MNTITQEKTVFLNTFIQQNGLENFQKIVVKLKIKAKKEGLSASEHILYNMIRGLPLNRGFSTLKVEFTEGFNSAKASLIYYLTYQTTHTMFESIGAATLSEYKALLQGVSK